jgi:hypothetical protein
MVNTKWPGPLTSLPWVYIASELASLPGAWQRILPALNDECDNARLAPIRHVAILIISARKSRQHKYTATFALK